jgi:hypothetical protein
MLPSALRGALLLVAPLLCAAQISGVVHDPNGAPVAQASLELAPGNRTATSNGEGAFRFDRLPAGAYRLTISHDGFEPSTQTVDLGAKPVELSIVLTLAALKSSITVTATSLRNSDPNYQALRNGRPQQVWHVDNLVLHRDAATFTFRSGSFSFLPPVLGRPAVAVFTGDGNLQLIPAYALAAKYLKTIAHTESVDEGFTALAIYFTDSTYDEITSHAERVDEAVRPLESVLEEFRSNARRRTDIPISYLETLLGDDDVPNSEADLLAQLYNGETGGFRAFIRGKKHSHLRFILDPRGALPAMPAQEEVALLNYDTLQPEDGIWYLSHQASELASGHAGSTEDHRLLAPEQYRIDVSVNDKSLHIAAQCSLQFHALKDGVRMVRFELLPDLEVSGVTLDGDPLPFVQEARRHDGSFYLQFPQALARNAAHEVVFQYGGGQYIQESVPYSYTTGQRIPLINPLRPWYPRVDATSRARFDLTFHVARNMTAVSVGKLVRKIREGSQEVFQWIADTPVPPAGFLYGDYILTQRNDARNRYLIESYLTSAARTLPQFRGDEIVPVTRPAASADIALTDADNSIELFTHWYGALPYGRLGVVEALLQGSLPSLVCLPAAALGAVPLEALQRGGISRAARVLDEALPMTASRQWWGALVSPASFHDLWLVRGLANFSAALYDEAVGDKQSMRQHWSAAQLSLMRQDSLGLKVREAPAVWFGPMADIHSSKGTAGGASYDTLVSGALLNGKGGFIIQMLRELMHDAETGDRDFIAMLRDFTSTYAGRSASTEDFRAIVERHMKPSMVMDNRRNMEWYFNEWVFGNEIPSYRLDYSVAPAGAGTYRLAGTLTQSGVSEAFRMRARVYVRLSNQTMRAVQVGIAGSHSAQFEMRLPADPKEVLLNAENDVLTEHQEVHRVQ